MKKFYMMALAIGAATVAFSGNAGNSNGVSAVKKSFQKSEAPAVAGGNAFSKASKFTSVESLVGEWELHFESLFNGEGVPQTAPKEIEIVDAAAGKVAFEINVYKIVGTVDLEANTFTIENKQLIGEDYDGDVFFYIKERNGEGNIAAGASQIAASVGTIDGYTITFPKSEIWAIGNYENEDVGWYFIADNVTMNKTDIDPNEGWTNVGTGKFVDGWMAGGLGMNPKENPWIVNVQQNNENSNLYRLDQPYSDADCPFASRLNASRGYIQFDITDPTFVAVYPEFSGVVNQEMFVNCTNIEGYYLSQGISKEQIMKDFEGKVTIYSSYEPKTGTVNFNNCRFTLQGQEGLFTWDETTIEQQTGSFTFDQIPDYDGIEGIVSDENSPVEYYNIQGVRINEPAQGQLVIVRRGYETSKIVVR